MGEYTPHAWTANEVLASAKLNNLENGLQEASREAIKSVKAMADRGGADVLAFGDLNSNTNNGVTFTRNEDGSWTVTGTATATLAIHNFYYGLRALPEWMIKGKTYSVKYETTASTPGTVRLQVWFYKLVNGKDTYIENGSRSFTASGTFTVPDDAEGCIVRLVVDDGKTAIETVTLAVCSGLSNAELEAAQNDLAPRVDAAEAACGEEDGYLWVGTALSGSYYGITWAYNGEDEVMLWGTLTSANRRLLCLNGQNAIKGTSGTFEKTLEKGAYTLEADARGYAAESAGSFKWVYSYDTFATEQTAITISDFHAQIVLDAPAMLGFLVTGGVDFGTEDSPTILTLRASRKTAVDTVARKAAAGLPKAKPIDTFVDGGYITLNGTTADIYNPTSSTNYRYAVVPCEGGDLFTISGSGGTAPRLWGFIDGSGTVLAISDYDLTAEDVVVEAPGGAQYLVINDKAKDKDSFIGMSAEAGINRSVQPATGALTDADAAEDNRMYEITSGAVSNLPAAGARGMLVTFGSGSAQQQFFTDSNGQFYMRFKWGGTWKGWFQIAKQAVATTTT